MLRNHPLLAAILLWLGLNALFLVVVLLIWARWSLAHWARRLQRRYATDA